MGQEDLWQFLKKKVEEGNSNFFSSKELSSLLGYNTNASLLRLRKRNDIDFKVCNHKGKLGHTYTVMVYRYKGKK